MAYGSASVTYVVDFERKVQERRLPPTSEPAASFAADQRAELERRLQDLGRGALQFAEARGWRLTTAWDGDPEVAWHEKRSLLGRVMEVTPRFTGKLVDLLALNPTYGVFIDPEGRWVTAFTKHVSRMIAPGVPKSFPYLVKTGLASRVFLGADAPGDTLWAAAARDKATTSGSLYAHFDEDTTYGDRSSWNLEFTRDQKLGLRTAGGSFYLLEDAVAEILERRDRGQ